MSQSASLLSIYQDEEFWYKLDVDYEAAEEHFAEVQARRDDDDEEVGDSAPEDLSDALLQHFEQKKGAAIESRYGSEDNHDALEVFHETVRNGDSREAKQAITSVYVEYIWIRNDAGEVFESEDATMEEVSFLSDDDRLVREYVNEDFDILWPGEAEINREIEDGEVSARKYYETTPVILRKSEDEFEVRGRKKNRKRVVKRLRNVDELEEHEPDRASEAVVDKIQNLLDEDNTEFRVTGVDFSESDLPEKSELRVKNESAVYRDLEELREENLVSMKGISEVNKLYLQDMRLGGKFRVSVKHSVEGVQFELEASHKTDRHRKQFKNGFTDVTDIEFDTIYEYGAEDQRYLFNKILSENGTAYDNYYEELDDDLVQVLEGDADATGGELLSVGEEEFKTCSECSVKNEAEVDECEECQCQDFSEPSTETVLDINDTSVTTYLKNRLEETSPEHSKLKFNGCSIERREMANRKILRYEFTSLEIEGRGNTSSHETVYLIPYGNLSRPGSVNDYLLQAVYLTYGGSESTTNDGYGSLSLYDVITSDSLDELIGNAIYDAIIGIRDRIHTKALEANETANRYYGIVAEEGSIHEGKDRLEDIYSANFFEKHLFYLLKELFPYSERWGRIGEREADGVLICPKEDSSDEETEEYYVGTFDTKLSHREDGYDLGAEEEDQATRYMLGEDEREAIQNITGDRGLSAHILISQNFSDDRSDFARIAGHVQEDITTYTGDPGPKLVFMEFHAVLELFEMYQQFWRAIRNSGVRKKFDQFVIEALNEEEIIDGEQVVHFNADSVSEIRGKLLNRVDDYDLDEINEYSS